MSGPLRKKQLILFLLLVLQSIFSLKCGGQVCSTAPQQDCGPVNAQGGVCASQTIFCIGDSVGFINQTITNIDSSYICWGDGIVQGFAGMPSANCIKHLYTFPQDSCVGGDGRIPINITLTVVKHCPSGRSQHGVLTSIAIKFRPKAQFTLSPSDVCVYENVSFINTSCPNSLNPSYLWNFGDGTTSTLQSPPPHQYTSPGNYSVTLTVTNTCASASTSSVVQVRPATTVSPLVNLLNTCAPGNFIPDVNSMNATGFQWSFSSGSGNIAQPNDSQPYFTLNNAGLYGIHLQVTGCCSAPSSDCIWDTTVTLYTGPTTSVTPIPDACGSITFNPRNYFNINSGTVNSYNWSFPGGLPSSSTSATPGNITYNNYGTYIISLVMNTPCGPKTLTDTFSVLRPTTVRPTLILPSVCPPITFIPSVNSNNSTGFNWTVIGGNSSVTLPTDSQPTIAINAAGTYTIQVQAQGCCTDPLSRCTWDTSVTVLQPINLSNTSLNDYCGSAVINPNNFFSASGNISSYAWAFPGGMPSNSSSSSPGQVSYSIPGTYIVTLNASGPCGTKSISDTFIVAPPTRVNPVSNLPGVCTPLVFNPTVNSLNANSYQWSVVSGLATITLPTDSQPSINVTSSGSVNIGLNVTGCCTDPQSDCSWDTTFTVLEGPSINISPFPVFCNSASLNPNNYFSTGGAISTYSWSFPGGSPASSSSANPGQILFSTPGKYPISLTLNGTCGSITKTDTLVVGAPPIVNITPSSLFGCDSLTIYFANTSPLYQTYLWTAINGSFVNGTSTTSKEPTVFFNAPGAYAVSVETFSAGCPSVNTNFLLNIGEAPKLSHIQNAPDICDSIYFVFSDFFQLLPAISDSGYLWTLQLNGSQIFSTTSSNPPSQQLIAYGTYIATALARNVCDTILLTDTFTFTPPPTLVLPADTSICTGTPPLNLTATPAGGLWTWNNTLLSGQFNPNITTDQTNYIAYSYGQLTCAVKDSFLVSVFGADINAGQDTGVCKNAGTLAFYGSPIGGYWNGNGIIDSLIATYDPSINISGADTLIYLLPEPTLGCLIRDSIIITVYSPTPGSINLPDSVCINQLLTYSNNQPGTSAIWMFGDNTPPVSTNNTTHSYALAGNYTISLYITNTYGCKDTITRVIEVAEPPNAIFSLDTIRGCAVLPINIQNLSNYYGATIYAWDYGDGQTDTVYNPGTVYFDQGPGDSTIYHIRLTASNGCGIATYEDSITVYPIPVVDFGISYTDSCSPATIHFANTTTGRPENYYWYVNGVYISSDSILAPQVFTTDSLDSTYYVTLITTNFCGSDTLTKSVIIRPNTVKAFFNTDFVYGCQPLNVTFTSYVSFNSTIQWDFGDGNTGFGEIITHTFDTAGIFTVWQFVDNYCGYDSVSQTIQVLPQPNLSFTVDSINCENEPVQFTNTSVNLQGTVWSFGDGTPLDSSSFSPSHYYSQSGQYPVAMIGVAASTGCRDTIVLSANVVSIPNASFIINDNDGCAPFTVDLLSSSTGGNYYVWDLGNGDTVTGYHASYIYLQTGTYSINLTSIDNNGCADDTSFNSVIVYPVPVSDFQYVQNAPCTIPTQVLFTNTSIGASNYGWNFGSYGVSPQQDPTLNFNSAANFNASLIAINNYGCSDTISRPIKVYDKPHANFSLLDFLACVGQPISFINQSSNVNTYYWNFGNGLFTSTDENPVIAFFNPGTYSVTLHANNDSVCFDSLGITSPIQINPKPLSDFTYYEITDTIFSPNGIFQFIDQSIGGIRWNWNFNDGSTDSIQSPIHRFYTNGNILIKQITYNEFGCPDTSFQYVLIDYFGSLFIPNAFSPDAGNEETSYFIPKGVGLREYLIEIYSPYGELVWYSDKLINGQPAEKWDGIHNNSPSPQGAYTWKVRAIFENGNVWKGMRYKDSEKPKNTGSVILLR